MEDFSSVKNATDALKADCPDYLLLNAGAYSIPRKVCDTGYDNVFQINFLSQFYMAKSLADGIKSKNGKIIAVGSIAHNYSESDINDIDFSTRTKSSLVYGNSKRYLMCAMYGLQIDKAVDVAVTHPGITFTNITAHYPKWIFAIIKYPMKIIFMPAKKASLSVVQGFFQSCKSFEWIGPRFFNIWGNPSKKNLKTVSQAEYSAILKSVNSMMCSFND